MEPDPVLVSNTREWLLRAKEDLNNAQHDLTSSGEGDEGSSYVARLSLSEYPQS